MHATVQRISCCVLFSRLFLYAWHIIPSSTSALPSISSCNYYIYWCPTILNLNFCDKVQWQSYHTLVCFAGLCHSNLSLLDLFSLSFWSIPPPLCFCYVLALTCASFFVVWGPRILPFFCHVWQFHFIASISMQQCSPSAVISRISIRSLLFNLVSLFHLICLHATLTLSCFFRSMFLGLRT